MLNKWFVTKFKNSKFEVIIKKNNENNKVFVSFCCFPLKSCRYRRIPLHQKGQEKLILPIQALRNEKMPRNVRYIDTLLPDIAEVSI